MKVERFIPDDCCNKKRLNSDRNIYIDMIIVVLPAVTGRESQTVITSEPSWHLTKAEGGGAAMVVMLHACHTRATGLSPQALIFKCLNKPNSLLLLCPPAQCSFLHKRGASVTDTQDRNRISNPVSGEQCHPILSPSSISFRGTV